MLHTWYSEQVCVFDFSSFDKEKKRGDACLPERRGYGERSDLFESFLNSSAFPLTLEESIELLLPLVVFGTADAATLSFQTDKVIFAIDGHDEQLAFVQLHHVGGRFFYVSHVSARRRMQWSCSCRSTFASCILWLFCQVKLKVASIGPPSEMLKDDAAFRRCYFRRDCHASWWKFQQEPSPQVRKYDAVGHDDDNCFAMWIHLSHQWQEMLIQEYVCPVVHRLFTLYIHEAGIIQMALAVSFSSTLSSDCTCLERFLFVVAKVLLYQLWDFRDFNGRLCGRLRFQNRLCSLEGTRKRACEHMGGYDALLCEMRAQSLGLLNTMVGEGRVCHACIETCLLSVAATHEWAGRARTRYIIYCLSMTNQIEVHPGRRSSCWSPCACS